MSIVQKIIDLIWGTNLGPVDVNNILVEKASKHNEKLDWQNSIVDLLKALDMDSSLQARQDLALELGYSGPRDGSAAMNNWLHQKVMARLAANGGKF